ncbi:uncharacterized protein LOC131670893 [Phymastichus coffea]|uniref:uncharacterized protein LOC131670893 n=1 Tax=Phymastichus coffea TaxID=108790 RepID=UPI00273B4F41|nr:uncharacterized protein LOC131670893 [Phymastichus coffea]
MSKACHDCPFNVTDCFMPHCVSADGVQKRIYAVNRQVPGPLVEVCEDDLVVVEVRNQMLSESTTIHWHGFNQKNTPYMDGVPYVTQCPILPGQSFTYSFEATTMGTFFWHSHIGSQKADGMFGPMIVNRRDLITAVKALYDQDEHRMIISDWNHLPGDSGITRMYHYKPDVRPKSILVNGRGHYRQFEVDDGSTVYTPPAVFPVDKDKKYRIRLINAGAQDCPIEMSIDNHTMIVISLDSNDIVATEVDWITIWQGERVDFIVRTNQKPDNYWIRYRGYSTCRNNATSGVYQVAILHYNEVPLHEPTSPIAYQIPKSTNATRVLNPFNSGTESWPITNIAIPNLTSLDANDVSLSEKVDHQVYISFDFHNIDNYDFHRKHLYGYNQVPSDRRIGSLQLNHISLKLPQFPLLSQWQRLAPGSLCNSTHTPKNLDCKTEQCACTHVIQVKLNSVVEIVLIDQGKSFTVNHPFHLHGHFFRVVAEENLGGVVTIDRVKQLDKEGKIKRRLNHPPMKDTMKTPGGGYTIVRFHANNPGYWFFHCHFDQHHNVGMALVVKVGEHKDFPKKPKGFPKCGSFKNSCLLNNKKL